MCPQRTEKTRGRQGKLGYVKRRSEHPLHLRGGHDSLFHVRFCGLLHSVDTHMRPPDRSRQSVSPRKKIQQHDLQILHDQTRVAVSVGLFQFANPERRYHLRGIGLPDDKRDIDDATRFDPGADLQLRRPLHGAGYSANQELMRLRRIKSGEGSARKDSLEGICVEVSVWRQVWARQSLVDTDGEPVNRRNLWAAPLPHRPRQGRAGCHRVVSCPTAKYCSAARLD